MKIGKKGIMRRLHSRNMVLKCVAVFLFPFFLAWLYLFLRGISVTDLYLPNSVNNDTLFYYKLVDGIVYGGMPKGYFGFNESHALVGSLGAWSPVILLPWAFWGKLFGFSYAAMLFSNLFFFGLALVCFVLLAGVDWKQIGTFMILFTLFPSLPIHLLSGLPEVVITSILIIFLGLCIHIERTETKTASLVWAFIIGGVLTTIRPYMVLCLFLPGWYLIKIKKKFGIFITGGIVVSTLLVYYMLGYFFTAPYFEPLFDLGFVKLALRGQLMEAYYTVTAKLKTMVPAVWNYICRAFTNGLTAGTQYVTALLAATILGVLGCFEKDQAKEKLRILFGIICVCLLAAVILLLGKANEGGRHFFMLAVSGILLCSLEEKLIGKIGNVVLAGVLIIFLVGGAMVPTDYDVPVRDERVAQNLAYWTDTFDRQEIEATAEISFDNTVMWVLQDWVEGDYKYLNHRELFALPRGFGLNCCMQNYVLENWENLHCKYIAMIPGGTVEELCLAEELEEIGKTEQMVIYRRY